MSEFIKRIQARLQAAKKGSTGFHKQSSETHTNHTNRVLANNSANILRISTAALNPVAASKMLMYLLMLTCASTATYWLMRVIQAPGTPGQPSNGISKGLILYSNQDTAAAYALFGSKPLAIENIYLRGVVSTSKNPDGTTLDGFAIFEIDGKPTNAIGVGENMGKGLNLHSIGDEQATLIYQGQKLNFKLSKPTKDKADKSSKKDAVNKK